MQGGAWLDFRAVEACMRPLVFQVLRALSPQYFVSGAKLASVLGVSRSAISDALMQASAHGVNIFKVTRRGYRLAEPLDLLDIEVARRHLGDIAHRFDIHIVETIESTNSELTKQAAAGAPGGTCIAAEIQTRGRGRRGREWKSALATSLTFSLLWRFDRGAAQLGGLSLAVGLAIVRALRLMGANKVALKWPNDIVLDGKKLGGVLIESQGDMLGPSAVVIGIGLNVRLPAALIAELDQPVVNLQSQLAGSISRSALLAAILQEQVSVLEQFGKAGFAALHDEWIACHSLHERPIRVIRDNGDGFDAVVRDVAADGSLIVDSAAGRMLLSSGEISVREASMFMNAGAATNDARSQVTRP